MATSEEFMVVAPYEWVLKNVERNVQKTFASKMILFRGERVFRVGLKNDTNKLTLIFMSINLNKMGLNVKEVVYWYSIEGFAIQSKLEPKIPQHIKMENHNGDCSLQFFTSERDQRDGIWFSGNVTFFFRIYIDGIVPKQYRYQLSDRLLKQQLWAAVKNKQHGTDVELLVKGTKFFAHKAILAARSPVFAAELSKKEKSGAVPCQLKINNVNPSTVEQFLYFLYTGESMTSNLANKELLTLAEIYKLKTLTDLCRNSLKELTTQQLASIGTALVQPKATCPLEVKQQKDTEIFFDQNISIISLQGSYRMYRYTEWPKPKVFRYKNEEMFFLQLKRSTNYPASVQIQLMSAKHLNFGLKVVEVSNNNQQKLEENWEVMNQTNSQENARLSLFARNVHFPSGFYSQVICFRIKVVSKIENNCFEMVDTTWAAQLWLASIKRQLTDVDIIVGEKILEAHRVILCARSPVFYTLLNKISNTGKPTITIGAEFELANVEQFLKFLYTGSLDIIGNEQLLALAELYEVETLKKICRVNINQNPDVEDLTSSLLAL